MSVVGYAFGQCTWYVGSMLSWLPGNLGNASEWLHNAQARGLPTGRVPLPGAVAVWGANMGGAFSDGHVGIVQSVDKSGRPVVSEMNWAGFDKVDTRDVSAASDAGIIGFIYPPGTQVPQSSGANGTVLTGWSWGPFNQNTPGIGGLGDAVQAVGSVPGAIASAVGTAITFFFKAGEVLLGAGLLGFGIYVLMKHTESGQTVIRTAEKTMALAA